MILIDGYVFVLNRNEMGYSPIFGKGKNGQQCWTLFDNGLIPFSDLRTALKAAKLKLTSTHEDEFHNATLGSLQMRIAESEQEVFLLRNQQKLVVIAYTSSGLTVYGQNSGGLRNGYVGTFIDGNGLQTFDSERGFNPVLHCLQESQRQGGSKSTVATFDFNPLGRIVSPDCDETVDPKKMYAFSPEFEGKTAFCNRRKSRSTF